MIEEELDVRQMRKPDKHPAIFAAYADLVVGQSFVLPDHDVLVHVVHGAGRLDAGGAAAKRGGPVSPTVRPRAEALSRRAQSVDVAFCRAQQQDLVGRAADPDDARVVRVVLTTAGERLLGLLSALHRDELHRMGSALTPPPWPGEVSRS